MIIIFNISRGTSGIDIDLRRVDIDQCPQRHIPGTTQPLNIFAGTDKCKQRTTEVREISILFILYYIVLLLSWVSIVKAYIKYINCFSYSEVIYGDIYM